MANKLKKMLMSSVDFVRRGANQDADIMLYKSADGGPDDNVVIMKSDEEVMDMIEKSEDTITEYADAIAKSIISVLNDPSMDAEEAQAFMEKSLSEFDEAVKNDIISEFTYTRTPYQKGREVGEMKKEYVTQLLESFDKSALSDAETDHLEALLTKACGGKKNIEKLDFEDDDDDDEFEFPPKKKEKGEEPPMKKSAGIIPPAIQAALDRMESLAKGMEMKEYEQIAKKYENLGEDTDKLAKSLYDMKQVGDDAYNSYVAALDKSLNVLEKAGMFGEIGKSAHGIAGTGYGSFQKSEVESKIDTIAKSLMEKDPTMTEQMAKAAAWDAHPELAVEYENSRA